MGSGGHFHKRFRKSQIPQLAEVRFYLRICFLIIWCKFAFAVQKIGKFRNRKPMLSEADRIWGKSHLE